MEKKGYLSDFDCDVAVWDRQSGLGISQTADLLGFSLITISRIYRGCCVKFLLEHSGVGNRIWHKQHEN